MTTISTHSPLYLHLVTNVNRLVALRHRGAHQSRTAGHVGTGRTFLVAPMAQRGLGGKHRIGAGR